MTTRHCKHPLGKARAVLTAAVVMGMVAIAPAAVAAPYTITGVDVTQVLGKQFKTHYNFVAGKSTAVSAYVNPPITTEAITNLKDRVYVEATPTDPPGESFRLEAQRYPRSVNYIDFYCSSLADCNNWAAGKYSIKVVVDGATKTWSPYTFKERRSLKVLALPVKAYYSTRVADPEGSEGVFSYTGENYKSDLKTFTQKVYPVADGAINWTYKEELNASTIDLDTEGGQKKLWQKLQKENGDGCPGQPEEGAICYDIIVGFIAKSPTDAKTGNELAGYTFKLPGSVVVGTDKDARATVAHELAHGWDVGDTYDGSEANYNCSANPPPKGFKGNNILPPNQENYGCPQGEGTWPPYYDEKNKAIGELIPDTAVALDVLGRTRVGMKADFMSSSGKDEIFWITPAVYDWLFQKFAPAPATVSARAAFVMESPPQKLIDYMGDIEVATGKVSLEPWESFDIGHQVVILNTVGDYTIQAVDAGGQVLATQALEVVYRMKSPSMPLANAPFTGTMAFPDGTVAFQIVKNGVPVKERLVSTTPPKVTTVTIGTDGEVTWGAEDSDTDRLYYEVAYNADPANTPFAWMVLASDLEETNLSVDFSLLAGGAGAKIRVTATDGILTGFRDSDPIAVARKAPEVFITEQVDRFYEVRDQISLVGEAHDLNDGWLKGNQLQWASDIAGVLGSGSPLLLDSLPKGVHTITLRATNTAGQQASRTITLTVTSCTYSVSRNSLTFVARGGTGTVTVKATGNGNGHRDATCNLTDDDLSIATDDGGDWLKATVVSFSKSLGQGSVRITAAANGSRQRRDGDVSIRGREDAVAITQQGSR